MQICSGAKILKIHELLKRGNMAKFLLDTCTCISIFRDEGRVRDNLKKAGIKNCYISEITIAELYFGVAKAADKSRKMDDIKNIQEMFKTIPVYPSLKEYGEIRLSLERTGQRIDQFDLLIGATAIHHNMIVVTSNIKHFERITGIVCEDWK